MRVFYLAVLGLLTSPARACTQPARQNVPSLAGTWSVEFTVDSAGRAVPAASKVVGSLAFGVLSADSAYGRHKPPPSTDLFGRSRIDFTPFFGGRVASDVSTTIVGPVDTAFTSEAIGGIQGADSLQIELIPRISHGGVSMWGRLYGDSASGRWEQRAYCCGARGQFRMRRMDAAAPALALPPRWTPPPPLDTTRLGRVRVRVWDEASGRYVHVRHALLLPGGARRSVYNTADGGSGWGVPFWLEPGRYAVELDRIPCGGDDWFVKRPVHRPFTVQRGTTTEVTVAVDFRHVDMARSYNNPAGRRCTR